MFLVFYVEHFCWREMLVPVLSMSSKMPFVTEQSEGRRGSEALNFEISKGGNAQLRMRRGGGASDVARHASDAPSQCIG